MQRSFLVDTVCRLAAGGVGQFLELGCGVPAPEAELVHQAAQREMPSARVVYAVDDPVVLAHAQQFLRSGPDGVTGFVPANLTDTDRIVAHAAETLDLAEPVVVSAVGVPHHLTDQDDPHGAVACLLDAVAPGSYLVLSHLTADLRPEPVRTLADIARSAGYRLVPRSHSEVCEFFDGLDLEDPGVALLEDHLAVDAKAVGWAVGWAGLYYTGIGRKPGGSRS